MIARVLRASTERLGQTNKTTSGMSWESAMSRRVLRSVWIVIGMVSLLSACGGGGRSNPQPPANTTPVADAGPDVTVFRNSTASLDGSHSADADGNSLTFKWSQTSGPAVTLSSDAVARPTFLAPRITGSLGFSLVVNDGRTASSADTVVIQIQNRVPTANAGSDRTTGLGVAEILDGRGSSDPDGDTLTYTWTLLAGSATAALQTNADWNSAHGWAGHSERRRLRPGCQ
jgi:K319L-like, PKD domain